MGAEPESSDADLQESLRGQMQLARTPFTRWLFIVGGTIALILGLIGLLIPGVPTTPFLLLTAFCYARGSERFYIWLLTNRYFGAYIRAWKDKEGIPLKLKIFILFMLWAALAMTALVILPFLPVQIIFALAGVGVTIYIVQLPTRKP